MRPMPGRARCSPPSWPACPSRRAPCSRRRPRDKQHDGWLATLKGPVVQAILTFADDRALRKTIYTAYNTRASDQGPHATRTTTRRASSRSSRSATKRRSCSVSIQRGLVAGGQDGRLRRRACSASCAILPPRRAGRRARVAGAGANSPRASWASPTCSPGTSPTPARNCASAATIFPRRTSSPISRCRKVMAGLFAMAERVLACELVERHGVDTWHPDVQFFDVLEPGWQHPRRRLPRPFHPRAASAAAPGWTCAGRRCWTVIASASR